MVFAHDENFVPQKSRVYVRHLFFTNLACAIWCFFCQCVDAILKSSFAVRIKTIKKCILENSFRKYRIQLRSAPVRLFAFRLRNRQSRLFPAMCSKCKSWPKAYQIFTCTSLNRRLLAISARSVRVKYRLVVNSRSRSRSCSLVKAVRRRRCFLPLTGRLESVLFSGGTESFWVLSSSSSENDSDILSSGADGLDSFSHRSGGLSVTMNISHALRLGDGREFKGNCFKISMFQN